MRRARGIAASFGGGEVAVELEDRSRGVDVCRFIGGKVGVAVAYLEGAVVVGAASRNKKFLENSFHGDDPSDASLDVMLAGGVCGELVFVQKLENEGFGGIAGSYGCIRHGSAGWIGKKINQIYRS